MSLDLDVPDPLLRPVRAALEAAGVREGHVSVELVAEDRIRELNLAHRGKDRTTDVLSFPVDGTGETTGPRELGDVVICPEHTSDMVEAAVHGILHLCGYDHEDDSGEMLELQRGVLAGIGAEAVAIGVTWDVRAANEDDIEAILAGYEWLFAPPGSHPDLWDPDRAREALAEAIGAAGAVVLVADAEGRVAGFCTGYIDIRSVRFGTRCWVEDLAVDPAFRSAGIGAELLAAVGEWALARGATHLELDSADTRADAQRFYEREQPSWRAVSFGWQLPREPGAGE